MSLKSNYFLPKEKYLVWQCGLQIYQLPQCHTSSTSPSLPNCLSQSTWDVKKYFLKLVNPMTCWYLFINRISPANWVDIPVQIHFHVRHSNQWNYLDDGIHGTQENKWRVSPESEISMGRGPPSPERTHCQGLVVPSPAKVMVLRTLAEHKMQLQGHSSCAGRGPPSPW